jgi:hypothetical protein
MSLIAKRALLCFAAIAIAAAGITAAILGLIEAIAFDTLLSSPHEWKSKVVGGACLASVFMSLLAAGKVLQRSMNLKG